jgi:hypothetical protein
VTLDESTNHAHAAALERGEDPSAKERREHEHRIEALAQLLGQHERDLNHHFFRKMAGRLVAYAPRVTELLAVAPPKIHRDLRASQPARYSDEDSILERLHELRAEEGRLYGYLRAMGSAYADPYNPDDRGEREDVRRETEQRHDEAAADAAPKVRAS